MSTTNTTTTTSKGPGALSLASLTDREFALMSFAASRTLVRSYLQRAKDACTPEVRKMLVLFARDEARSARRHYAAVMAA